MKRLLGKIDRFVPRTGLWWAAALAVVLISGGAWWLLRTRNLHIPPVELLKNLPPNIEFRLNHVTLRGISNGKIVWEVDADHFDLTKNQRSFVVSGLKKMTLIKDGKQELTINADGLEQTIATGDINIFGHVMVSGKDLSLRTPGVFWSDRSQLLIIPQKLTGQFGEITVVADKGARYSINNTVLNCDGGITVGCRGNMLRAGGVELNANAQSLRLAGPVHVKLMLSDVQEWVEGRNLPQIPEIPDQIRERYQEFCRKKGYRY